MLHLRSYRRLLICLLLGVVSTVVVGVLGPRLGERQIRSAPASGLQKPPVDAWMLSVPKDWGEACHTVRTRTAASTLTLQHDAESASARTGYSMYNDDIHVLSVTRSGWPWGALQSVQRYTNRDVRPHHVDGYADVWPIMPLPLAVADIMVHGMIWLALLSLGRRVMRLYRHLVSRPDPFRLMVRVTMLAAAACVATVLNGWLCTLDTGLMPMRAPRWVGMDEHPRSAFAVREEGGRVVSGFPMPALRLSGFPALPTDLFPNQPGSVVMLNFIDPTAAPPPTFDFSAVPFAAPAQPDPFAKAWREGVVLGFWPFGDRHLPLRPAWPGFLINLLLHAGVIWFIADLHHDLRRARRLRRGHCPDCNYDCAELDVCPECGSELTLAHGRRNAARSPSPQPS